MGMFIEDCQGLLQNAELAPTCSGFLRTKNAVNKSVEAIGRTFAKLSDLPARVAKVIPWTVHFVVLHDNVLFIFKDETARKPEKRIRLNQYKSVKTMEIKDAPWPFILNFKGKAPEIFSASTKEEQEKWIKALNEVPRNNDSQSSDSDYEEPLDYNEDPTAVVDGRRSASVGRGPLPDIPHSATSKYCEDLDQSHYEDPDELEESANSCKSNESRKALPAARPNKNRRQMSTNVAPTIVRGVANGRSKVAGQTARRPSNDGSIERAPAFVPVPSPGRPPICSKPPPPPPNNEKPSQISNKKAPPLPPAKPTVKIYPQPKQPNPRPNEEYDTSSILPYEINLTLKEKAMWTGSADGATSTMLKLSDEEGTFLLRTSSKGDGYTMHVICNGTSKKFSIKEENKVFQLSGDTFNNLDDLIEHFRNNSIPNHDVALRIRPLMEDEIYNGATPVAHKVDDNMVVIMDPADDLDDILRQNRSREKQYMFDVVLDATSTQHNTYTKTCKFLIPSIIEGYNATVFAYGATGAGKTYTMLGRDDGPGIMAQALTDLFEQMNESQERLTFKVSMSYLEIYNEMIRDLLSPNSGFLDLREDHSAGLQVAGLSTHEVTNTLEVMDILKEGNKQRTQEPTAANKTSSRSHAVLIIHVRQRNRLAPGMHQQFRMGKLILIDLAGSERAANTQNRGKRMVEGAHINRSLLALGNCINALGDKSGSKYVNYRDSKLTRLLKDALGGNCKTVMVAHISPASFHFEESRNTLSYADRAKNIKTKVRQNVLDMTLHISQYSNVITDLKEEIRRLKTKLEERGLNRNLTTMQAIQAEVLSQADELEISRLKNELEDAYRSQLDYRQALNELKSSQSEINLELTRHQMMVNSYKRMKTLDLHSSGQVLKELSSRNINKMVRELADLELERSKMDATRESLERQLTMSIVKTAKIEEEMFHVPTGGGGFGASGGQKEAINLLAKIHRLELENLRTYEESSRQLDESRHRGLVIELQLRQCDLADEIIRRQRELIVSENVNYPKELQDLYSFFRQEMDEINNHQQKLKANWSVPSSLDRLANRARPADSRQTDRARPSDFGGEEAASVAAPSTADNNSNNRRRARPVRNFPLRHAAGGVRGAAGGGGTPAVGARATPAIDEDDVSLFVADMSMPAGGGGDSRRASRDERALYIKKNTRNTRKPQLLAPLTQSRLAEHNRILERSPLPPPSQQQPPPHLQPASHHQPHPPLFPQQQQQQAALEFSKRHRQAIDTSDSVTEKGRVKRIYKQRKSKVKSESRPPNTVLHFKKTTSQTPDMFVKGSTFRMK